MKSPRKFFIPWGGYILRRARHASEDDLSLADHEEAKRFLRDLAEKLSVTPIAMNGEDHYQMLIDIMSTHTIIDGMAFMHEHQMNLATKLISELTGWTDEQIDEAIDRYDQCYYDDGSRIPEEELA